MPSFGLGWMLFGLPSDRELDSHWYMIECTAPNIQIALDPSLNMVIIKTTTENQIITPVPLLPDVDCTMYREVHSVHCHRWMESIIPIVWRSQSGIAPVCFGSSPNLHSQRPQPRLHWSVHLHQGPWSCYSVRHVAHRCCQTHATSLQFPPWTFHHEGHEPRSRPEGCHAGWHVGPDAPLCYPKQLLPLESTKIVHCQVSISSFSIAKFPFHHVTWVVAADI